MFVVFAAAEFRGKATLSQPLDLAAKQRNPAAVPPPFLALIVV
jgi:hypothetical protein